MPRPLRIEYAGAIYHVMNRGDRREAIFKDDMDRMIFVKTLGEACVKTAWQIHAWCLMGNHFHMVIETPRGNLVAGMKWMMGTYTQRFNRRHKLCGHLFQGRYKAQVIDGENSGYLRTACDYVHLNPVRAGLLIAGKPLTQWNWSSYGEYVKAPRRRVKWLRTDRLFGEHGISRDDTRGRQRLVEIMESQRSEGTVEPAELKSLRRGWRLGPEDFLERLLQMMEPPIKGKQSTRTREETDEAVAARIMREELIASGSRKEDLAGAPKGHPDKVRMARRLRTETSLPLKKIAALLYMGSPNYVSHLLFRKPPK